MTLCLLWFFCHDVEATHRNFVLVDEKKEEEGSRQQQTGVINMQAEEWSATQSSLTNVSCWRSDNRGRPAVCLSGEQKLSLAARRKQDNFG